MDRLRTLARDCVKRGLPEARTAEGGDATVRKAARRAVVARLADPKLPDRAFTADATELTGFLTATGLREWVISGMGPEDQRLFFGSA